MKSFVLASVILVNSLCAAYAGSRPDQSARGADAYLTEAEGGIGLQAWLEVEKRYGFYFNLSACPVNNKMGWICLALALKNHARLPSELRKLANAKEDDKIKIGVCLNETCQLREWEFLATGFGDMFTTHIALDEFPHPTRSIRIMLKNGTRYEYRGDVDHIVSRICDAALCRCAKCPVLLPLPKEGCPTGYYEAGENICAAAPPMRGECPSGWKASGDYCIPQWR